MYFPYFRGRQYELIALRELAISEKLGNSIIPIVEPVKKTSTFDGTYNAFVGKQKPLALIFNPAVGDFAGSNGFVKTLLPKGTLIPDTQLPSQILPALLMNANTPEIAKELSDRSISPSCELAILNNRDFLESYKMQFTMSAPRYTLFPDERELRRTVTRGKVMFKDNFNKQPKNADYPDDEFYTEDHLYFSDEGYAGFSDYSIIGSEYNESGFAPYAVAIHIVYFTEKNTLRVRHFVSDSNDNISDIAGKFNEAVTKLANWYADGQQNQLTYALQTLLTYFKNGYYPGLPTIKKLSIMHHLELVGKFLDRRAGE